jgi:hypothetical protein
MELPVAANELLAELLAGIRHTLGDQVVGVYLRGSLATGDFNPATSDVDLLAVTDRPVDDAAFAALSALHSRVDALPNRFAGRVEIAYIDAAALRRYAPGRRHPTLGRGETLAWTEHHANWVLERWVVREQGVTLYGPAPATLIDPIPQAELVAVVRTRLADWAEWANQPDDPDWRLPLAHKAYVVETMCRALYTLREGGLAGKRQAVTWALATLPDPWRGTVTASQAWRDDNRIDLSVNPAVRAFVLWVAGAGV